MVSPDFSWSKVGSRDCVVDEGVHFLDVLLLKPVQEARKFLTSAAILVSKTAWCRTGKSAVTPLRPSQSPFQVSSVPVPNAVTRPTPVTTLFFFQNCRPLA